MINATPEEIEEFMGMFAEVLYEADQFLDPDLTGIRAWLKTHAPEYYEQAHRFPNKNR